MIFEATTKGKTKNESRSLANTPLNQILSNVFGIMRGPQGDNVEKVEVVGYEQDSDDSRQTAIDIVANRFLNFIELDEPRENTDLLEAQRKKQIKDLYAKCLTELDNIFKTD